MGNIYLGDAVSIARKAAKLYIGDANNIAREVKKIYIGDANGIAREAWSSGPPPIPIVVGTVVYPTLNYNDRPTYRDNNTYFTATRIAQLRAQGYTKIVGTYSAHFNYGGGAPEGDSGRVGLCFYPNGQGPYSDGSESTLPWYAFREYITLSSYVPVDRYWSGQFEMNFALHPNYNSDYSQGMVMTGYCGLIYGGLDISVTDASIV